MNQHRAFGSPGEGVDGVMAVAGAEAVQDDFAMIRLVAARSVFEEHQVRLGADIDAALAELDAGRQIEFVGEDGAFVGLARAFGVFEDQDLIVRRRAGQVMRVGRHRRHPESALRVPGHGERIMDRKLALRGEQVDFVSFGQLEVFEGRVGILGGLEFLAADEALSLIVDLRRFERRHLGPGQLLRRQRLLGRFDLGVFDLGVFGRLVNHHVELIDVFLERLEFAGEVDDAERPSPATVDVLAVDRSPEVEELGVAIDDGESEPFARFLPGT